MKLMSVRIRGFRSIENMTIPFEGYGHKILVGKNESGKSNILKALQLLSDNGNFNSNQRKEMFKESNAIVQFLFELEQDESESCRNAFIKKFLFSKNGTKLTNNHTIESFYDAYANNLSYRFRIDQKARWRHWSLPNDMEIANGWHCVDSDISGIITEPSIPVGSYIHDSIISKNTLSPEQLEALNNCLSTLDEKKIRAELHNVIKDEFGLEDSSISTIYWKYNSEEYDLPSSKNMEEFSENPDCCLPLKSMFSLAGYPKHTIKKEISEAKEGGLNSLRSLLNKVSRETNQHIKKNWQEYNKVYKNVEIQLRESGDDIGIAIQDSENLYSFEQRSDGFRRFVSFLLLMTKEYDSLILLDEPETGLHPSSAKDLRDVLIELGKKNIVVYATHSISMIDTQNIENNLIVSKEGENTSFEVAKEDGTSTGELVYKAIGHSIYDDLKKKNILLEGYTDKKVIKLFMQSSKWKSFGICYTDGVDRIKGIVPMLELVDREYFIMSDADYASVRSQKKNNFKHWYTYAELGSKAFTVEDFYKKDFFNETTKSVLEKNQVDIEEFPFNEMTDNNRMDFIKDQLSQKKCTDIKKITDEIKITCANNATKAKVDAEKINSVLEKFLEKIKGDATE